MCSVCYMALTVFTISSLQDLILQRRYLMLFVCVCGLVCIIFVKADFLMTPINVKIFWLHLDFTTVLFFFNNFN